MVRLMISGALAAAGLASVPALAQDAAEDGGLHPMVVIDQNDVIREEAPPHGAIGMSTAYRISDAAPDRAMEFRIRTLHVGAAVGVHRIGHDEVYFVVSGEGEVTSDGETAILTAGMTAYLYDGAHVGIAQRGEGPLTIIIAYPLAERRN